MNVRFRKAVLLCVSLAAVAVAVVTSPRAAANKRQAELIVFGGGDFDGPSLSVRGTLYDMPEGADDAGGSYDWNDTISSIVVVEGTWRLYENGRLNTALDGTPSDRLDVRKKRPVGGWSAIVSAERGAPLRLTAGDGVFGDNAISSIELVSTERLREVAARKGRASRPEIVVYRHNDFGGERLVLRESLAELPSFTTETGETLGWSDSISSIEVKGGTWRLCENRDFNASGGWSLLVSATREGNISHTAAECGGWTNDSISSIELVSDRVLEAWAVLNRKGGEAR